MAAQTERSASGFTQRSLCGGLPLPLWSITWATVRTQESVTRARCLWGQRGPTNAVGPVSGRVDVLQDCLIKCTLPDIKSIHRACAAAR